MLNKEKSDEVSDIRPDESVRTGNTDASLAHKPVNKKSFLCNQQFVKEDHVF
jgi:hypothetical protein